MTNENASRRGMRCSLFLLALVVSVVVDQATKAAVRVILPWGTVTTLIPGLVDLMRVENTGAAFSMGEGAGLLFVVVAVVVTLLLAYLTFKEDVTLPMSLTFGAIAGGGLGNMIDRLAQGSVTDFLAFSFVNFPVFNVADICVTVGTFLAVVSWLRWDSKRDRADQGDGEAVEVGR